MNVYQRPEETATVGSWSVTSKSNVEAIRAAIVDKYPPCISVQTLGQLIDRRVASIRVALSTPTTEFDHALRAARFWIGGRIQFQTLLVAHAIAAERARSDESGCRAKSIQSKQADGKCMAPTLSPRIPRTRVGGTE